MTKKISRLACFCAIGFISAVCITKHAGATPQTYAGCPDHVLYSILFNRIAHFESLADRLESAVKPGAAEARSIIKHEFQLTSAQAQFLTQIALKCVAQAKAIAKEASKGSPNLAALYGERSNIFLNGRQQLLEAFGQESFANFEALLRTTMSPRIKRVSR